MNWNWNPLVGAALLLPTWAYAHGVMHLWRGGHAGRGVARWQVAAFALGMIALFIALISPVDTLGEQLLSAHMVQHVLLMIVAPPLLVIGVTPSVFLWALPLRWRRVLGQWGARSTLLGRVWRWLTVPAFAWLLHALAIWTWHLPGLYQAALQNDWVHWLEHATFFSTALLFWHAAVLPGRRKAALPGMLLIFGTALHSSILGALMAFAGSVWYPLYAGRTQGWGLSALEDQQLAGLIMWIPAGIVYVVAGLWLLAAALQHMERPDALAERATKQP